MNSNSIDFRVRTPSGAAIQSSLDDNVDIQVLLQDGRTFAATFFTLQNVRTLMQRYKESGECAFGTYLWAKDMILVEEISEEVVRRVIVDLLATGEFESCLTRL